ncbi:MAG: hypothetical protein SF182_07240 [Deltaproteobacteria bacterium]|nr:hypothetical protein [Deltaproteobacteria bacterium]
MAQVRQLNEGAWLEWLATRPQCIRDMAERLPPDRLYRMRSTGHRVTLVGYAEDGTVRVYVSGQFNAVTFERQVYGVAADDLEECDLPSPVEPVGAMLTEASDIDAFIETTRAARNEHQ